MSDVYTHFCMSIRIFRTAGNTRFVDWHLSVSELPFEKPCAQLACPACCELLVWPDISRYALQREWDVLATWARWLNGDEVRQLLPSPDPGVGGDE